jgi:hypothetical protein
MNPEAESMSTFSCLNFMLPDTVSLRELGGGAYTQKPSKALIHSGTLKLKVQLPNHAMTDKNKIEAYHWYIHLCGVNEKTPAIGSPVSMSPSFILLNN